MDEMVVQFMPFNIVLYTIEVLATVTAVISLWRHLVSRYQDGFRVNMFMLTLCFFISQYSARVLTYALLRYGYYSDHPFISESIAILIWIVWFLSHLGSAIAIVLMTWLIVAKVFNLYISRISDSELQNSIEKEEREGNENGRN